MTARVGIVGTFDVLNFGDLLFPLLAQHELRQRLGDVEVIPFSYRAMSPPAWPFEVRSLSSLSQTVDGLDLLLLGGGDLVRFDRDVAPGYGPTDSGLHHPTAYWLMPALLAASRGVPVAWNAVGLPLQPPAWTREILRLAAASAAYVSVRDQVSFDRLTHHVDADVVSRVPDSAYRVRQLRNAGTEAEFMAFARTAGVRAPYLIVQPAPELAPYADTLKSLIEPLRAQGYSVVEVPFSPLFRERCGPLGIADTIACEGLVDRPLLLAEIIARADAVIVQSLHPSIVALANGVPVNRMAYTSRHKDKALRASSRVRFLDELPEGEPLELLHGRSQPDGYVRECALRLIDHWDRIASLIGRRRPADNGIMMQVMSLYGALGGESEQSAAALERSLGQAAGMSQALDAGLAQLDALQTQINALQAQINALQAQINTLQAQTNAQAELTHAQATTLQTQVNALQAQANAQAELTHAQTAALQTQIDAVQARTEHHT